MGGRNAATHTPKTPLLPFQLAEQAQEGAGGCPSGWGFHKALDFVKALGVPPSIFRFQRNRSTLLSAFSPKAAPGRVGKQ